MTPTRSLSALLDLLKKAIADLSPDTPKP